MGKIFYIMGKSASGKDKIYSRLAGNKELDLKKLILYTTRPVRDGEKDGVQYYFTDERRLQEFETAGKVIGVDLDEDVLAGHVLVDHLVDGLQLAHELLHPAVQVLSIHAFSHTSSLQGRGHYCGPSVKRRTDTGKWYAPAPVRLRLSPLCVLKLRLCHEDGQGASGRAPFQRRVRRAGMCPAITACVSRGGRIRQGTVKRQPIP